MGLAALSIGGKYIFIYVSLFITIHPTDPSSLCPPPREVPNQPGLHQRPALLGFWQTCSSQRLRPRAVPIIAYLFLSPYPPLPLSQQPAAGSCSLGIAIIYEYTSITEHIYLTGQVLGVSLSPANRCYNSKRPSALFINAFRFINCIH